MFLFPVFLMCVPSNGNNSIYSDISYELNGICVLCTCILALLIEQTSKQKNVTFIEKSAFFCPVYKPSACDINNKPQQNVIFTANQSDAAVAV